MEETGKQKYIKIQLSDFSGRSLVRSEESYFRSLEKYLEKNKETYELGWKSCTIYVYDKNHAMRLGLHFDLPRLDYFDGVNSSSLILKSEEKKRGKPKSIIFDETGKSVSLRKLIKQAFERVDGNCIEDTEVIKRKILTKREIAKALVEGKLSLINIMNKRFIDRQELARFLKNNKKLINNFVNESETIKFE